MQSAGKQINIYRWLLPLSWIYGLVVNIRNWLFDKGVLKTHTFPTPVICVGNLTVGGTGKTPHVEYLIRLLSPQMQVAVLSRGYKRKTKGYRLADEHSTAAEIGDEPYQMSRKFPQVHVAVDANRCEGITRLTNDNATRDTQVVILDDAFQHRHVKPGLSILLTDYHRPITLDCLLPAGRLREPLKGKERADIVIVTKCPSDLSPMDMRVFIKALNLRPYQQLYFTSIAYGEPYPLWPSNNNKQGNHKAQSVLLLTGIASPQAMMDELQGKCRTVTPLTFPDHHAFTPHDVRRINEAFASLPEPRVIITTEKDATRLQLAEGLSADVRRHLYVWPIVVRFLNHQSASFNQKIESYVRKN